MVFNWTKKWFARNAKPSRDRRRSRAWPKLLVEKFEDRTLLSNYLPPQLRQFARASG